MPHDEPQGLPSLADREDLLKGWARGIQRSCSRELTASSWAADEGPRFGLGRLSFIRAKRGQKLCLRTSTRFTDQVTSALEQDRSSSAVRNTEVRALTCACDKRKMQSRILAMGHRDKRSPNDIVRLSSLRASRFRKGLNFKRANSPRYVEKAWMIRFIIDLPAVQRVRLHSRRGEKFPLDL
jgi:hypothetical protein